MSSQHLLEQLQAEYGPRLDSSLIIALASDIEHTPETISVLRTQLDELAAQTYVDDTFDPTDSMTNPAEDAPESGSSRILSPKEYSTSNSANESSFNSPMAFLSAAFPDMSQETLRDALMDMNSLDFSMEKLVEELLSRELAASLEAEEARELDSPPSPDLPWNEVSNKRKKRASKPKPVPLVDIRQRQHLPSPTTKRGFDFREGSNGVDPWSHLSSVAAHLSTLLPPHSPETFLSAFHSPKYTTPYDALVAFLGTISNSGKRSPEEIDDKLISLMTLTTTAGDDDQFDAVRARKCIIATDGRVEDAFDLLKLLEDMEFSGPIVHMPAPQIVPSKEASKTLPVTRNTGIPPKRSATVQVMQQPKSPTSPRAQTSANAWQYVEKKVKYAPSNPHADYIPAYQTVRVKKVFTEQMPQPNPVKYHRSIEESWQVRRAMALKKASVHWQKGRTAGHGGAIAAYYAEEAQKYLAESRNAAMQAARATVEQNRRGMDDDHLTKSFIDLHGLTKDEAIVIVQEAIVERMAQADALKREAPLRFITGKGNHSRGNVSVLSPAIIKHFTAEGYNVRQTPDGAGVIVYGRSRV